MSLLHVATNAEHVSLNRAYMHVAAIVPEHIVKLFIIFHEEFFICLFFCVHQHLHFRCGAHYRFVAKKILMDEKLR